MELNLKIPPRAKGKTPHNDMAPVGQKVDSGKEELRLGLKGIPDKVGF